MVRMRPNDLFYFFDVAEVTEFSQKVRLYPFIGFIFIFPIFVAYQAIFFLLGWMPDDWGGYNEGDWISTRSNFSYIFGFLFGVSTAV